MGKERVLETIDENRERLTELAEKLWENPELPLSEYTAMNLLSDQLEADGFTIERGVGPLDTAFIASYGEGSPTIGILGEYDALPGMSQAVTDEQEPVQEGDPGHGCGHNLFGAGSYGGALAIKQAIERGDLSGTIRFYGCPAEEGGIGKVFMEREGVFDDLDVALSWHPWHISAPWRRSSLAMDSLKFEFRGTSAHAATAPDSGRSALDAIQLLNTGIEYMREHVPSEARLHYTIIDGGESPNIVPPVASGHYYVRAPKRRQVQQISNWLDDIAEGAALMTQTEVEKTFFTGTYDYLANETLTDIVYRNMQEVGSVDYTDEDREFAADIQDTFNDNTIQSRLAPIAEPFREDIEDQSLYSTPHDLYTAEDPLPVSTDVGNVSWVVPTAQFWAPTWPVGTPAHTWQAVTANGSFGRKGAVFAAKVLAGTAYDLLSDSSILEAAATEFEAATESTGYHSPLPDRRSDPIIPETFIQ